jgi:hypothetical protein
MIDTAEIIGLLSLSVLLLIVMTWPLEDKR